MTEEKPPRIQCKACPWKKSTDPYDIPNGYDVKKHKALKNTINEGLESFAFGGVRAMACHETKAGKELPCVGWLINQIGPGNNLGLRFQVICGQIDGNVETVGPQHETFEQTLPKKRRRKKNADVDS